MRPPLVSIIIPAYNAASVLPEALSSVQQQIHQDWEAIVVDDGSGDDTFEIAARFAQNDPRIRPVQQANGGPASARNRALAGSRGAYVAFLDADDTWMPEKLERQLKLAEQQPDANFIFANYLHWDGTRDLGPRYKHRRHFPSGNIALRLMAENLFGTSTVLMKRTLIDSAGPFEPSLSPAEDWDLWLRVASQGIHAAGLWEPVARYRGWPGNLSHDTRKMAAASVRVIEQAAHRAQSRAARRACHRSLQRARANLVMAQARPLVDQHPQQVSAAIFKAWRSNPRRLKWLVWHLATRCPAWLGGARLANGVHRKIASKWS